VWEEAGEEAAWSTWSDRGNLEVFCLYEPSQHNVGDGMPTQGTAGYSANSYLALLPDA